MLLPHSVHLDDRQGAVTLLFAGQGGQYPEMSSELHRCEPVFRAELDRLDALARDLGAPSVVTALYQASTGFDDVLVTHPAIFMVQYALARTLIHYGVRPGHCLGMSTGEFAAAAIAGVLDVRDALYCVVEQSRALSRARTDGGMLAVVRPPRYYQGQPEINRRCSMALAGRSHFVIAGRDDDVHASMQWLREQGVTQQRLPVRVGFHSAAIDAAREPYLRATAGIRAGVPEHPIVSCVTGEPLTRRPDTGHFWAAIRQPIKAQEAIASVIGPGRPAAYVDIGPGGVLSTFLRQARVGPVHSLLTPAREERRRLHRCIASVSGNGRALEPGGR